MQDPAKINLPVDSQTLYTRIARKTFGDDLREAEDFALKVEHDKRARTFVDPKAGRELFRDAAGIWLDQHLGADSSIATYRSVLRAHIDAAIGGKPIGAIRREDIKALIAAMRRKGLSASRIGCAHLVISAVLAEAVRDKKLAESPCSGVQIPAVVTATDFILPAHALNPACSRATRPAGSWACRSRPARPSSASVSGLLDIELHVRPGMLDELVRSTGQSQRLAVIKAPAPVLLGLSSRFTGCQPPPVKS